MLPQFSPMRLGIRREPFDHPDWLYELKYDGFRALAFIESGSCRLVSRKAHVYQSFPSLCASLAQLPHDAILDGEIVCLDQEGHPQFDELFRHHEQPYFAAFDIPHLDHRDLRDLPLIERKKELRRVVQRSDSRQLLYVSHIEAEGVALFQEVCRRDLEGIVVKWKHGPYVAGDETSWEKIKNPMYSQMIGRWDHLQRKRVGRESHTNAVSVAPRDSSAEQG